MKIQFSPPDITEDEIAEVADALRSGWITTGPKTKLLEKNIADLLGTTKCVCLNSQTACAELALRVLGVTAGDEVITTPYTYTATVSVICHVGATPVFVDIQKDKPEMDYDMLEKVITDKTKAIIPVDIAGIPCDYDRIFEIVERKKNLFIANSEIQNALGRVAVMADTAHSFGAKYKEKMIGNVADFSSFSFHAVKNLTTAEGGALTWRKIDGVNDDWLYKQIQNYSLHGQSVDAITKSKLGCWEYDIIGTWYKCNMTDVSAAIGISQLRRYSDMLNRRKEIISRYDNEFKSLGLLPLEHYTDNYQSSGHLYMIRVPGINVVKRNEIITKMAGFGIACNVHYKPLPMHTAYMKMGFDIKDYPNSYNFFENEITLPLHTSLTDDEINYIIEKFKFIVREYI